MNFDFVSSNLLSGSQVKSVSSGSGSSSKIGGDSVSNLFLSKLHQILAKNGISRNTSSSSFDKSASSSNSDSGSDVLSESLKSSLLKDINSSEGVEILSKLKQYLAASGYTDLKSVSVGENGLNAIRTLLSGAGFSNSQISDLLQRLKSESEEGKISLSSLMDGLMAIASEDTSEESVSETAKFDLDGVDSSDDDKSDDGILMDMSSVSFLSNIMRSLGISEEDAGRIIEESEVKGEGIRLNRFITGLQSLQSSAFFSGTDYQNSTEIDSLSSMFGQLGLSNGDFADKERVTLGDFVSSLEELRKSRRQSETKEKVTSDDLQSKKSSFAITSSGGSAKMIESSDSYVSDLNKTEKESISAAGKNSGSLLELFMSDLKSEDNGQSTSEKNESAMRYQTLKNMNHQLLMSLSEDKSSEDSAVLRSDSAKMVQKFNISDDKKKSDSAKVLNSSSGYGKEISDGADATLKEIESKKTGLAQIQSEMMSKAEGNSAVASEDDNRKNSTIGTVGTSIGKLNSDTVRVSVAGEHHVSNRANENSSKSGSSSNSFETSSGAERRTSLMVSDSGQSGSDFSGGNSGKDGTSGLNRERLSNSALPSYVTNQVSRSIARAMVRGENEITLQLRPAELGRILMTIETNGDVLKVKIVTENKSAKDILSSSSGDLKQSLAGSGINIETFDVEMASDFKQSMANSGQQSGGSDSGRNRGSEQDGALSAGEIGNTEISNFLNNEDGVLHFVA